jgi:hypothetical protein
VPGQSPKQNRVELSEIIRHFADLEDTRSSINQMHPFTSVLVIALMAVLGGRHAEQRLESNVTRQSSVALVDFSLRPLQNRRPPGEDNRSRRNRSMNHHRVLVQGAEVAREADNVAVSVSPRL